MVELAVFNFVILSIFSLFNPPAETTVSPPTLSKSQVLNSTIQKETNDIVIEVVTDIAPSPTPTPEPTATPTQRSFSEVEPTSIDLETLFSRYAQEYQVDKEVLKKIAKCESGLNPGAHNFAYAGLYQFSPLSWSNVRNSMGLDSNADLRLNAAESIRTAAYLISKGQLALWPNC